MVTEVVAFRIVVGSIALWRHRSVTLFLRVEVATSFALKEAE
ncbi:6389_t:CDS:2, partial [Gigaspora rosea]